MAMSDELMTTIALRLEATVRVMLSRTPETENFDDVPRPFGGASLSASSLIVGCADATDEVRTSIMSIRISW